MIKFILIVLTIIAALIVSVHASNLYIYKEKQSDAVETIERPAMIEDLIVVNTPLPNMRVGNPIQMQGEARGFWFFEASAPVTVVDWDGRIIGEGFVTTDGEWMTEEFVSFSGTISYDLPEDSYSTRGAIIFRKDNPSGLPENDKALEFPIEFIQ